MAEDEIIKKHTKAVYKAWRDPEKDWKSKVKDIFLEIIVIVFAVTVSIWFHNWSESVKDRNEEKVFLKGLRSDIDADLKEMMSDRASLKLKLLGVRYFRKVGNGMALNKDSLTKHSWIFLSETQIDPRIGRFEALKSSGKLDIIENKKLQYDITDLYQKNFPLIYRYNQRINSLFVDKIEDFISGNIDFGNGSIINTENVLHKSKMRFLLMQAEGVHNCIDAYDEGINKGKEIIKQIDQELK